MDIREEMELDEIKREERLQQFIKEERARVLARRKAIVEKRWRWYRRIKILRLGNPSLLLMGGETTYGY